MAKRDRSARDDAYRELRDGILTMRFAPGSKLDEVALAAEIGASRTPVREALFHLASEGLIDVGERGGYHVSAIEIIDCQHLFEAQLLVARATSHLLVASLNSTGLRELSTATKAVDEAVATGDPALISKQNAQLHTLESQLGGNPYISGLAARVYTHTQRLAYMSFSGAGPLSENLAEHHTKVCEDHWAYLDAIRNREVQRAEEVATRHVALFRDRIFAHLQQDLLVAVNLDGLR